MFWAREKATNNCDLRTSLCTPTVASLEEELLTHQLENAQMAADEDPKLFFARKDELINTLKSAGVTKEEREINRNIIRNLPDEYDVERRGFSLNRRFCISKWKKSCGPYTYAGPNC